MAVWAGRGLVSKDARLAGLVADVQAWLEAAQSWGYQGEMPGAALEVEPVMPEPERGAPESRWAALASSSLAEARAERVPDIAHDLGDCRRCRLATGRSRIVFGVGNPEADLVIIGEAPGFHEDRQGEPFVGRAGEMLDKMLVHVLGLQRQDVYISNIVKCRPPNNRKPLPDEVDACLPFLERQIRAVDPKVMLVLGSVALRALFSTDGGITRARGNWRDWNGIPVMPTFHPAYLLRNPDGKRATFDDLKALRVRYDEAGGRR